MDEELIRQILQANAGKEFVQRILDPKKNPTPIKMPDGSFASHLMAAEVDENGEWFVFPTVVNSGGKLEQISDPRAAMERARQSGEFISFGKDKDAALNFSKNYKTPEFKRFFFEAEENEKLNEVFSQ